MADVSDAGAHDLQREGIAMRKTPPMIRGEEAAKIDSMLDAIEVVVQREIERAGEAHLDLPDSLRLRLLRLGSSTNDLVLWIRRDPEETLNIEWYVLKEVESGVITSAASSREACERYFSGEAL
jgi:hypothetical protein